jgi:hypothetical protein
VSGPSAVVGGSGLGGCQSLPVSSPVEGFGPSVPTLDASEAPNALKPLPMAREAVLLWRQNARPWNVRFLGTLVSHNGLKVVSVVDTTLDSWIKVFRADLEHRIRG